MKLKFERPGSGDGEKKCERREWEKDITFTVSQLYTNAFEWWNGDNIAASLVDPDYEYVGSDGCDITNVYQITGPNTANNPTTDLTDIGPAELCTNYFRWYEDGGGLLYLMITGTQSCASAQHSKKRRSKVCATFEIYTADDVLVFETKPADALPDLWYEGEASYPIGPNGEHLGNNTRYPGNVDQSFVGAGTAGEITLQFFNCYTFGNGVESYRIKDSMVGKYFTLGNRAYATSSQDYGEADRFADLTYSGVINDESNVNKLNEFNLGLLNFKPLEDSYGEIMKLDGRKTDILVLQEHKISYVLAGKDLLSDAGGGGALTSTPLVLGKQIARQEEYGISRNPESYVQYAHDKFFTDVKRGAVLQLRGSAYQNEELNVISEQGMRSWFRDQFLSATFVNNQKIGGYDPYMNEYVVSINDRPLPPLEICTNCAMQFSIDTSVGDGSFSYCINLGTTVGDVTIAWDMINAGTWAGAYTWNTVTTPVGPTAVSGSVIFTKTSTYPTTLTFAGNSTIGSPSFDLTVGCPVPIIINVIQVCLTTNADATQTIHNQTNYVDGVGYTSPLMPTDASAPVVFAAGTDNPLVSQYDTYTGEQGFGGIPTNGSTVHMYTRRINTDTFVFDNTADEYYRLRSVTEYTNTPADITLLLAAIAAEGAPAGPFAIDSTLAPNEYSCNFPMPGAIAGSGKWRIFIFSI